MYNEKDFEIIKNTILEEITPYQILLFGSYAKGLQNENSDIDLMVLLKEKISRKEKLNTIFRIENRFLDLDYRIDLILKNLQDFNEYKDYIGTVNYDIAREGKILWMQN
jgi:predicted nucleotidyltransferase